VLVKICPIVRRSFMQRVSVGRHFGKLCSSLVFLSQTSLKGKNQEKNFDKEKSESFSRSRPSSSEVKDSN